MAELVFYRRGEELMRVLLDRDRTVIGRGAGNDVVVPHPEVSRRQAAVERRGENFALVDLSGRGTVVAGRSQREVELVEGVDLAFGDFRAVFRDGIPDEERPTSVTPETTEVPPVGQAPLPATVRVRGRGGERIVPFADEMTVGKEPGNTIVLDDPYISASHLRITRQGPRLLLHDLDSTNGTFVDGVRVGQAEVAAGAVIRVGDTELVLEARRETGPLDYEGIVSSEVNMREVFELIDRVAPSSAPVAIFGETGTGKELVARAIHTRSDRGKGSFIPVNCAAISRELIESELFGHEKGAFTGALATRRGAFEEASGGTIFLDEIGELSAEMQAKLLRTLELGEVKRVGATRPFRVDTRVISATHRDLRAMVKKNLFREDLYYRLCVIRAELPPLRRRPADIPLLVDHFVQRLAPRGTRPQIAPQALALLQNHAWPGNVRELRNVLARALLLRKGPTVTAGDVMFDGQEPVSDPASDSDDVVTLPGKTLEQIETEAILKALRRHGGNRRATARELGMARSTMQKRAAELGVPPPVFEPVGEDDEG